MLIFAVTLSPVLGFMDFGYMNVSFAADRYQYLAGVGVLLLLVGTVAHGADRLPSPAGKTLAGVGAAVVLLLGTATWNQSGIYKDEAALFGHSASTHPESWAAHYYAGMDFFKRGHDEAAEKHLCRYLELEPPDESGRHRRDTLQNIGETLRRQGRYEEALETYAAAIEVDPDTPWPTPPWATSSRV